MIVCGVQRMARHTVTLMQPLMLYCRRLMVTVRVDVWMEIVWTRASKER
jgi:hypothetical protein